MGRETLIRMNCAKREPFLYGRSNPCNAVVIVVVVFILGMDVASRKESGTRRYYLTDKKEKIIEDFENAKRREKFAKKEKIRVGSL